MPLSLVPGLIAKKRHRFVPALLRKHFHIAGPVFKQTNGMGSNESTASPSMPPSSPCSTPTSSSPSVTSCILARFRKLFGLFDKTTKPSTSSDELNESAAGPDNDGHISHGDHDRRDFETIRAIPREKLAEGTLNLLYPNEKPEYAHARVTRTTEGSFHLAATILVETASDEDDLRQDEYILKIPFHGTTRYWLPEDCVEMRNEAMLMKHIRHNCPAVPVPEVFAFDETLNNVIGAPFILMQKMPGNPACDMIWFKEPLFMTNNNEEQHLQYLDADCPPEATEKKRITFLRSLVEAMAQLNKLEFDKIGVPNFSHWDDEKPESVGPAWRWHSHLKMEEPHALGPFNSSKDFFMEGLDKSWNIDEDTKGVNRDSQDYLTYMGIRKILEIIFSSPPFANNAEDGTKETFVLRHSDLNFQNILCDLKGNITGIIDWDGIMAVPRCVGPTSIPTFLRNDWLSDFEIDFPYMSFGLERYRNIFAEAMAGHTDARYTLKSPIYQMALAVVYEDEDGIDLAKKVLLEIPEFRRLNLDDFFWRLGSGWPAAEKVLEEKIAELLKPEG